MAYFAHTHPDFPSDSSAWEPLFTPFGEGEHECQRGKCNRCKNLEPDHGHLNKVAFWTAKFAAEMFSDNSQESVNAYQWGYLTGLWHDLGKFAPEWQNYLARASDTHHDEILEKIDHTTAGAKHAISKSPLGHFIATAIAGHHAGLLDARHETHASLEKRLRKSFGVEIPEISAPPEIIELDLPSLPEFIKQKEPSFSAAFF